MSSSDEVTAESLETVFLAINSCDLKTASLAVPYCGTETSFLVFNAATSKMLSETETIPERVFGENRDSDVT